MSNPVISPFCKICSWYFQVYPTKLVGGGEDWLRVTYGMPWTSTPIEGSNPIWCQVKSITSEGGDAAKLAAYISEGMVSYPFRWIMTFLEEGIVYL